MKNKQGYIFVGLASLLWTSTAAVSKLLLAHLNASTEKIPVADASFEYIVEFDLSEMSKLKYKKYILKQRKLINESAYSDYYNKEKCLNLFDRIEKIINDDSNA